LFSVFVWKFQVYSQTVVPAPSTDYCSTLTKCLDEVASKQEECSKPSANISKTSEAPKKGLAGAPKCSPASDPQLKSLQEQIKAKKQDQATQFRQCISDRKSQVFDVTLMGKSVRISLLSLKLNTSNAPQSLHFRNFSNTKITLKIHFLLSKQQKTCAKSLDDYLNPPPANATLSQQSNADSSKLAGPGKGKFKGKGKAGGNICHQNVARLRRICQRLSQCCSEAAM